MGVVFSFSSEHRKVRVSCRADGVPPHVLLFFSIAPGETLLDSESDESNCDTKPSRELRLLIFSYGLCLAPRLYFPPVKDAASILSTSVDVRDEIENDPICSVKNLLLDRRSTASGIDPCDTGAELELRF